MVYSAIAESGSQIYTLKFHYLFHEHQVCAYSTCLIYLYLTLYPSTSKILLVILLTVCHTIFII